MGQLSEKGLEPIQLQTYSITACLSGLFGIGKGTVLRKFKVNSALQQAADVFDETSSTPAEIELAGEKAMVVIYNEKMDDTLNSI